MLDTIAIKVADGSLKPIISTSAQAHRRIILSTESDNQEAITIELYRGVGQEMFDNQLLDTISIDRIPLRTREELDIALTLKVNDSSELDVRVNVEGAEASYGHTYNLREPIQKIDLDEYAAPSNPNTPLPAPPAPEEINVAPAIDKDFILGIDPYISYNKDDIRRAEWTRRRDKIGKGIRASSFVLCVLLVTATVLLLSFITYQGIVLPPLPPLEV